jgi:NTE family protein
MTTNKKIGLVLSGGAMHGFAQLGALRVLNEYNIKPDLIVGSSIGALIGAVIASGKTMTEVEDAVLKENLVTLIQPAMGQGLVKGEKIVKFILRTINVEKFEDLKTKLIINATNITKGEEIIFEKGNMLTALNASIAIPGMFVPVQHNGDLLVDGGFYDVLPIHLANKMDIIIVIDVSKLNYKINPKSGVMDIMKQSVANLQQRVIELNLEAHRKTHEIIRIIPNVSEYGLFEYKRSRQKEMIKIGEEEARKVLSDLRARRILDI